MFEICSKLAVKTYFTTFSRVSIIDFEQVNVSWVVLLPEELVNNKTFSFLYSDSTFLL